MRRFWFVVISVGFVLSCSGFVVASGAQIGQKAGVVCAKTGATSVVQGVSVVCIKSVSGKLVWRAVKSSPATTSTTSTTSVVAGVVAPRVVSASSESGNGEITIDGMSPDTGVYGVQWVPFGQDFNSYQMYRATTKTISLPYLSCARSYTLRVFVMQKNWQMTDGFINQNVTPHSKTFDLTMPACRDTATTATTTTVALTCATGGSCVFGDTGPGGGVVFYVATTPFACGPTLASTCTYLEAASSDHATPIAWSNITTTVIGSTLSAIGSGYKNTLAIVGQAGHTGGAAKVADDYTNNGKSEWYLPSKDELNELCKYARTQTTGNTATACANSGTLRDGFTDGVSIVYWSTSEYDFDRAWHQYFDSGGTSTYYGKDTTYRVRAVRAG